MHLFNVHSFHLRGTPFLRTHMDTPLHIVYTYYKFISQIKFTKCMIYHFFMIKKYVKIVNISYIYETKTLNYSPTTIENSFQ